MHLRVVVVVAEDRQRGRAGAAATAEVQLGVGARHPTARLLHVLLAQQRPRGRGQDDGPGQVVQAGGGGEERGVGLDRDAAAVALQGVHAVVRLARVALQHGPDGRDTGDAGGQRGAGQLGDVGPAARQTRRLQVAAHRAQGGDHPLPRQWLDPDAAVQRRGRERGAGVGHDPPRAVGSGEHPGETEVFLQPGHQLGGGQLRLLRRVRPDRGHGADRRRPGREHGGEPLGEGEHLALVLGVEVHDLGAGAGLLLVQAHVVRERPERHGVRPGVTRQVGEGDPVPPLHQPAAGRYMGRHAFDGAFAAPHGDGVRGRAHQAQPLLAGRREPQHDDARGQRATGVQGRQLGHQVLGEQGVGAAGLEDVDVAREQALDDAQRCHRRRVPRGDVGDQADRRPRLVDRLARIGPVQPARSRTAQLPAQLAGQLAPAQEHTELRQHRRVLALRQVRGEPAVHGVRRVAQRAGEGVAGGQDGLGLQIRRQRGLDGGRQLRETPPGLLVADEGTLPVVVVHAHGHAIPFISSAAATAQLLLRLTPARPCTVNQGV